MPKAQQPNIFIVKARPRGSKIDPMDIPVEGPQKTQEEAEAHVESLPPSVGAPNGYEVIRGKKVIEK